jgi:hypothetical protein
MEEGLREWSDLLVEELHALLLILHRSNCDIISSQAFLARGPSRLSYEGETYAVA